MSGAEVTISCPHCLRTYTMKIDPERLKRLKTRATCGRCGNTFDAASRIVPASEATTDPKLPRLDVTPVAQLLPTAASQPAPSPVATIPDLSDEMEELAREFAEAAARFTPVAVKRPAAVLAPAAAPTSTQPDLRPPPVEEPPPPAIEEPPPPASVAAPADVAPSDSDIADAYDQLSLEAAPAAEEELAAAVPTQSRAKTAPPRDWLDLADPGLASLQAPPSAGAAALEALLNESERIALPATSS